MHDSTQAESIQLFSEDTDFLYPMPDQLTWWIAATIDAEGQDFQHINIIFCSDEYLLEINREHLDHDYYTDIITFQYEAEPITGDLFISVDRVRDNAEQFENTFEDELDRVIIHGVLHMCGYGDKTEEEQVQMRAKEDEHLMHRVTGREMS